MSEEPHPMVQLLKEDPRYKFEAYQFVREALGYAQNTLKMGRQQEETPAKTETEDPESISAHHITGQQLCEAIRQYAVDQYGYLAKVVLNNWGINETGDFGEIVYNLIRIGLMKKSAQDRRADFDGVYDFDKVFCQGFKIALPEGGD